MFSFEEPNSLNTLFLKPASWKDFNSITVSDFCGLVLCVLLRAMCQWCTWADTDNSLRLTCTSRSSNQIKITTELQVPAWLCSGEITFSQGWRCPKKKAGLVLVSRTLELVLALQHSCVLEKKLKTGWDGAALDVGGSSDCYAQRDRRMEKL